MTRATCCHRTVLSRCANCPYERPGTGQAQDPATVVISGRQQGKTHAMSIKRVRAVAKGATINGTYKMLPEPALEAFRADLLALVGHS